MAPLVLLLVLHAAPASPDSGVDADTGGSRPAAARRLGVHLGLNATAAFDAELGGLFYGQVATQLTGVGNAWAPDQGLVLSAFVMGGVTLPLVESPGFRLHLDAGPHVTLLRSAPVNMLAAGLAAGLRLVYARGLTLSLKLPVAGYAGSLDQPRGSLLYYYVAAVPTMPVLAVGYSF